MVSPKPWRVIAANAAPVLVFSAGVGSLTDISRTWLAGIALLAVLAYLPGMCRREWLSWCLIAAAAGYGLLTGQAGLLAISLVAGAAYGALMIAISIVQVAARRSVVAQAVARSVSAGRERDASWQALLIAHLAGAVLNLSGLVILQAAAQQATADRQYRAATAVVFLRGFATAPVWSPYAYFTPLMLAAFPLLAWPQLLAIGLGLSLLFLVVSVRRPPWVREVVELSEPPVLACEGSRSAGRVWGRWIVFLAFFFSMVGAMTFSGLSSLAVVVVLLPILAVLWGVAESWLLGSTMGYWYDLNRHLTRQVPLLRTEVLALMAAGMASAALAQVGASWVLLSSASGWGLPGALLLAVVVFLGVTLLARLGVNPVLFVVPLAAWAALPGNGVMAPMVAVMILCCAWALFPTISPLAAANLVTARELQLDASYLVSQVNAGYNRWALVACLVVIAGAVVVTWHPATPAG